MWKFPTKLLVKLFLSYFWKFLRLCSVLTVFLPKETHRNCHSPLYGCVKLQTCLSRRVFIKISMKMICWDALSRFSNSFKVIFLFTIFAPQKYMRRFSTKFWVMLFLSYFGIFLKLCSVLTLCPPKKHPESFTNPLNGCGILQICLGR